MERNATAHWHGAVKEGRGSITTESRTLSEQAYSFGSRFEQGQGTNPEELIAAAHAGCFSMALALELGNAGLPPDSIDTRAAVSIEQQGGGFAITAVHLEVSASVPDADEEAFQKAANTARSGCPVSKLLNADISMDAKLT
jgi:osmotically inducible protein OsmC